MSILNYAIRVSPQSLKDTAQLQKDSKSLLGAEHALMGVYKTVDDYLGETDRPTPLSAVIAGLKINRGIILSRKRLQQFQKFAATPAFTLTWSTRGDRPELLISRVRMTEAGRASFIKATKEAIEIYVKTHSPASIDELPAAPFLPSPQQEPRAKNHLQSSLKSKRESPFQTERLSRAGFSAAVISNTLKIESRKVEKTAPPPFIDSAEARKRVFDSMYRSLYAKCIRPMADVTTDVLKDLGDRHMRVMVADQMIRRVCGVSQSPFSIVAKPRPATAVGEAGPAQYEDTVRMNKLRFRARDKSKFMEDAAKEATGGELE
ncbi:hypothetical protein J8273_7023 [Carpediemonas membranifera]|uniref:Uncharacterized protein n=1 Tax=Carpediemonas membranifera TaxID=201153 RepID=A0A8J6ARX9_9EUKA|nr:hypothetical protein J8273_7023 [Carpediemonas membranifera]|eukprot:KAG9390770.1 hypothetical protein J8273_7023 [Carpediemonas membranifera]